MSIVNSTKVNKFKGVRLSPVPKKNKKKCKIPEQTINEELKNISDHDHMHSTLYMNPPSPNLLGKSIFNRTNVWEQQLTDWTDSPGLAGEDKLKQSKNVTTYWVNSLKNYKKSKKDTYSFINNQQEFNERYNFLNMYARSQSEFLNRKQVQRTNQQKLPNRIIMNLGPEKKIPNMFGFNSERGYPKVKPLNLQKSTELPPCKQSMQTQENDSVGHKKLPKRQTLCQHKTKSIQTPHKLLNWHKKISQRANPQRRSHEMGLKTQRINKNERKQLQNCIIMKRTRCQPISK